MKESSNFSTPPVKRNGSRTRRYILAGIVLLTLSLAAAQIFLHQTSVGSRRFIPMTFLVYTGTVIVVLALLILATVLGRNLIKLYFERKSGQVGSGFKTKMVRTFIVLSLLPALLLFFLAYGLISSSMEQWFQAPLAQIMQYSRSLAQQYYAEAEQRAKHHAAFIAGYIHSLGELRPETTPALNEKLREFCRQYGLGNVRVFDSRGLITADAGNKITPATHKELADALVARSIAGKQAFRVERVSPNDPLNEIIWATAPVRDAGGNTIGAVLTESINPQSAMFGRDAVMEAYEKYEQLEREKRALRYNMLLILILFTLLIVFAFSWFALYLAKRITVPIQALAEGAAEVAAGNLEHRVDCQAFDELASLIASFNQMTSDLQENERRIETAQNRLLQTNIELDDRRRYIETILQAIATGVISLDSDYNVRTINLAAAQMLQARNVPEAAKLEEVVEAPTGEILRGLLLKSTVLGTIVKNVELPSPGKRLQLAVTVTPLAGSTGRHTGWVVVLEDMTELVRMEKMSAWQEVARRLAHEIKNPLTPIQLSAERILRRYKKMTSARSDIPEYRLEELSKFEILLNECVHTIIQEAGSLKRLVDEFSRFARLPEVRPEEADLHSIIDNTLQLYNGRIHDIKIQKDYDADIPRFKLDTEQMKRVFINLFDNALEAMAGNPGEKLLQLRTRLHPQQGSVSIEVGDTGRGFPEEYQDSLFLPYFSTRKNGTGLGLAIVRQIVSDHHGSVRAEPNEPAGTRIIIDLPLAPV